jgi:pimeloyl-ACP methyl ester carboxylesterase
MKTSLTLIALHGNGGGGFRFERMKPFIPQEVRFLAPTLPGFAEVDLNPNLKSLRDYAFRLREIIGSETKPIVLLAHGIGGSIALEFLQHFEKDIFGLILHAPVGTRLETRLFPKLMKPMVVRHFGQWLFSSRLARPIFKRLLFTKPVPKDYLTRFFEEYRRCKVFAQMFDIINSTWFNALKPVHTPTILLWGENERVLTADQAADYQKILLQSRIELVSNWDHFPMVEQPEDYTQKVIALAEALVQNEKITSLPT